MRATEGRPYESYLAINDVEHRRTRVKHLVPAWTNGFVERFHRTALDEFFATTFRTALYEPVEALQADFDLWPAYNAECPTSATATWVSVPPRPSARSSRHSPPHPPRANDTGRRTRHLNREA